jgi:uncharacterized protein
MPIQNTKLTDTIASGMVAGRWFLLVIALGVGAASYLLKDRAKFDNSIEGMFSPADARLKDYQRLKSVFGGAEIVLVVYDDPDLFSTDGRGLARLTERAAQVAAVKDVIGVLSLAEINEALKKIYMLGQLLAGRENVVPILDPNDEIAGGFLKAFENYTHGSDRRTAAIVCILAESARAARPRNAVIGELREIAAPWPQSQVTGEPVLVNDGFSFLQRDARQLNRRCLVLMALVILACFRSVRWFLIPVAIIYLSMWMAMAIVGMLGWKLTMVSSMLSAILAVISVATVVHLIVVYRDFRLVKGYEREEALTRTLAALMLPITWTCLTTAAGFFALTLGEVDPVSDFGWMMVLGTLSVWLSVFLLVPSMALFGDFDTDPRETWGESFLELLLGKLSSLILRHPMLSSAGLLFVMGLLGAGIPRLETETDFTRNFREDSQIVRAYRFVEDRLGGAGLLDIVIRCPGNLDRKFLEQVDAMQDKLRELRLGDGSDHPALTHVVSFADADRIVRTNAVLALLTPEIRFRAMAGVMPVFASQMMTSGTDLYGDHYFRIMLRTRQQRSASDQNRLIDNVRAIVEAAFPNENTNGRNQRPASMTTGFFVLLSSLVDSVLADSNRTFLGSCLLVALVMLIAFRSPRLVLIAMIPNIIPIAGLMGALGWMNIRLNMGAAMIAAVSIGLSIDGTIHYLTSWGHDREHGIRSAESIKRVQFRTGRAVVYATIALVIGFGSLCLSEFIPTVFFGGLVGLSMLAGMVGNLLILPGLLTLFASGHGSGDRDSSGEHRRHSRRHRSGRHHSSDQRGGHDDGNPHPQKKLAAENVEHPRGRKPD